MLQAVFLAVVVAIVRMFGGDLDAFDPEGKSRVAGPLLFLVLCAGLLAVMAYGDRTLGAAACALLTLTVMTWFFG